ncbi:Uncharacterized protein APZ42_032896 [Daphnia magna]|uniref:Uncharacterized protein n=1 Tax=Daphnia magna TaxID=35525 RepID=A0A164LXQ5_9CRUS|nr:Uncharacterized protein APZ42_032896 [Daphnia magna]
MVKSMATPLYAIYSTCLAKTSAIFHDGEFSLIFTHHLQPRWSI